MQRRVADKLIEDAVRRELELDPNVGAAHISVAARDDTVVLAGEVSSASERSAAVAAAERVCGVRALADEIDVKPLGVSLGTDADIAGTITRQLRWNTLVPDTVKADVENGSVTLRGTVETPSQREQAARPINYIRGVSRVINLIAIKRS